MFEPRKIIHLNDPKLGKTFKLAFDNAFKRGQWLPADSFASWMRTFYSDDIDNIDLACRLYETKFKGYKWHKDLVKYSYCEGINHSTFTITDPLSFEETIERLYAKQFNKEEKKMIAIQCTSHKTAKAIADIADCHFKVLPALYVGDLIKHIRAFYYTDLLYPNQVEAIASRYEGMAWFKDSVRYYCDGTAFFISEPQIEMDLKSGSAKKEEEKHMRIDITGVNSYNDRVVIVRFSDGTFTKSICSEKDTFDLDMGISLCLLKKMMSDAGAGSYSNLIRRIHKMMDDKEKDRKQALVDKAERRKLQEERHQRNIAKAAKKAKETYGDAIREAVAEAIKEASK